MPATSVNSVAIDVQLRVDEEQGLSRALPELANLAAGMGLLDRAFNDWERDEVMRFLGAAVRAAVPLKSISHFDPDLNDRLRL